MRKECTAIFFFAATVVVVGGGGGGGGVGCQSWQTCCLEKILAELS